MASPNGNLASYNPNDENSEEVSSQIEPTNYGSLDNAAVDNEVNQTSEIWMPNEIWWKIFSYLPLPLLLKMGQISRRFREISSHDTLWWKISFQDVLKNSRAEKEHEGAIQNLRAIFLIPEHKNHEDLSEIEVLYQVTRKRYLEYRMTYENRKNRVTKVAKFLAASKYINVVRLASVLCCFVFNLLFIAFIAGIVTYSWYNNEWSNNTFLIITLVSVFAGICYLSVIILYIFLTYIGCRKECLYTEITNGTYPKHDQLFYINDNNLQCYINPKHKNSKRVIGYTSEGWWSKSMPIAVVFVIMSAMLVFLICLLLSGYLQNIVAFNICMIPFYVFSFFSIVGVVVHWSIYPFFELFHTKLSKASKKLFIDFKRLKVTWVFTGIVGSVAAFILFFVSIQTLVIGLNADGVLSPQTNIAALFVPSYLFFVLLTCFCCASMVCFFSIRVPEDHPWEDCFYGSNFGVMGMCVCCCPCAVFVLLFALAFGVGFNPFYSFIPLLVCGSGCFLLCNGVVIYIVGSAIYKCVKKKVPGRPFFL